MAATGTPMSCSTSWTADRSSFPLSWRSSAMTTPAGSAPSAQMIATDSRTDMPDDGAALAVVLGLLAVEGVGQVQAVLVVERRGRDRRQRNPLVGGAVKDVEADARVHDRACVVASKAGKGPARVEQAGVEEIGAEPSRLQGEFAETQHPDVQCEIQKLPLVVLHDSKAPSW